VTTDWKWYFTPDLGQNGGAFEMMEMPTGERHIRKVSQLILGPAGQIGFARWVPLHAKMCEPIGVMSNYSVFPANEEAVKALTEIWKLEGTIMLPGNGRLFKG
jgi:hypothetical protein